MPTRHLITLGGGGFSMAPNPAVPEPLDNYILKLSGKRRPNICFIPTASGDSQTYVDKFLTAFPKKRANASVLRLFQQTGADLRKQLLNQDIIYVGGGNTANLLALWWLHDIDLALLDCWKKGVILCGISAGMNCWFEGCSTDSFGPLAPLNEGLGLVAGAACPHFDGEAERRPSLLKFIAKGLLPHTYAADDFAAFHFTSTGRDLNAKLHDCIKSKLHAGCYHITREKGKAVVHSLPTRMIG